MTEEQGPVARAQGPVAGAQGLVAGAQGLVAGERAPVHERKGQVREWKGPVAEMHVRGPGPVRLFRFLIYGLVLASSATQYSVVPILPVYAHRFGLTGIQQGMVLGATGLATLAVSVPAGAFSDRFGARRLTPE